MVSQRLIESNEMRGMVFTLAVEAKEAKRLWEVRRDRANIESRELAVLCCKAMFLEKYLRLKLQLV